MGGSNRFHWAAGWLLNSQARNSESAAGLAEAGAKVLAQLEQGLATLIGQRGARLLMVRALRAACARHAFLDKAYSVLEVDGAWDALAPTMAGLEPALVCDGLTAIAAEALALLSDFIGEDITVRQVRRVWPELPYHQEPWDEERDHEQL